MADKDQKAKDTAAMKSAAGKISGFDVLSDPDRKLIREGRVEVRSKGQDKKRLLFLFDDELVLAAMPSTFSGGKGKFRHCFPLKDTAVAQSRAAGGQFGFDITCGDEICSVKCESSGIESMWLSDFQKQIAICKDPKKARQPRAKPAPLKNQNSSVHKTAAGAGPPPMPSKEELERQFTAFLEEKDFKGDVRKRMEEMPDERKWFFIWSEHQQEKSRKPDEAPSYWVEVLAANNTNAKFMELNQLQKFRLVIRQWGKHDITTFSEADGMAELAKAFVTSCSYDLASSWAEEFLRVFTSFVGSNAGMKALYSQPEIITQLVYCIQFHGLRVQVMTLLTVIIWVCTGGAEAVFEGLCQYAVSKNKKSCWCLIECMEENEIVLKTTTMTFVNALINTIPALEKRVEIRRCLLELDFLNLLKSTRIWSLEREVLQDKKHFEDLRTQMDVFIEEQEADLIETTYQNLDMSDPDAVYGYIRTLSQRDGFTEDLLETLQSLSLISADSITGKEQWAVMAYCAKQCSNLANFPTEASPEGSPGTAYSYVKLKQLLEAKEAQDAQEKIHEIQELKNQLGRSDIAIQEKISEIVDLRQTIEALKASRDMMTDQHQAVVKSLEAEKAALSVKVAAQWKGALSAVRAKTVTAIQIPTEETPSSPPPYSEPAAAPLSPTSQAKAEAAEVPKIKELHKSGVLNMLGTGMFKKWTDRYFVLNGSKLYYYKSEKESKDNKNVQGMITLDEHSTVEILNVKTYNKASAFSVTTAKGKDKTAHAFHASNDQEMKEWTAILTEACRKDFPCPTCKDTFATGDLLTAHFNAKHISAAEQKIAAPSSPQSKPAALPSPAASPAPLALSPTAASPVATTPTGSAVSPEKDAEISRLKKEVEELKKGLSAASSTAAAPASPATTIHPTSPAASKASDAEVAALKAEIQKLKSEAKTPAAAPPPPANDSATREMKAEIDRLKRELEEARSAAASGAPPAPGAPGAPDAPDFGGPPEAPGAPGAPGAPDAPDFGGPPEAPGPGAPGAPDAPDMGGPPDAPDAPDAPGAPPGPPGPPGAPGLGPPGPPSFGGPAAAPAVVMKPKAPVKPSCPMRKFHWNKLDDKITLKTIWNNLNDQDIKLDTKALEDLFGERKSAPKVAVAAEKKEKKEELVKLIEDQKATNIDIALSRLKLSQAVLMESVLRMDSETLTTERLGALIKILPNAEDMAAVQSYDGDPMKLRAAERFILAVGSFPNLNRRLELQLFRMQYEGLLGELEDKVKTVHRANNQLQSNAKFKKLLEVVLAMGNYLNAGTKAGVAYGFKAATLTKLKGTKSADNKTTLLQYIIIFMQKSYPKEADWVVEFQPAIEAACVIEQTYLQGEVMKMTQRYKEIEKAANSAAADEKDVYPKAMGELHKASNPRVVKLEADFKSALKHNETLQTDYGEEKVSNWEVFFQVFKQFLDEYNESNAALVAAKEKEEKEAKLLAAKAQREASRKPGSEPVVVAKDEDKKGGGEENLVDNVMKSIGGADAAGIREAIRARREPTLRGGPSRGAARIAPPSASSANSIPVSSTSAPAASLNTPAASSPTPSSPAPAASSPAPATSSSPTPSSSPASPSSPNPGRTPPGPPANASPVPSNRAGIRSTPSRVGGKMFD